MIKTFPRKWRNNYTVIQENSVRTQEVAELPELAKVLSESTESTCQEELSENKPSLSDSPNTDEQPRLKCPEPKELFSWSYRQNEWNKNDACFMPRQGRVSIGFERFPVNYHWTMIALAFPCKYLPSKVALFQFLCAQYY